MIPAPALFQQRRAFGVLVAANGRAGFRPVRTGATDGVFVIAGFDTTYPMDDGRLARTEAGAIAALAPPH